MLKRMSGLPDGSKYELLYLKWLLKNKNTGQLCKVERSRWLSQTRLYLIEVVQGLDSCPITLDDFVYRIRLLIFSGEAKKAQSEITDFSDIKKYPIGKKHICRQSISRMLAIRRQLMMF
jgi:hypothetical protein